MISKHARPLPVVQPVEDLRKTSQTLTGYGGCIISSLLMQSHFKDQPRTSTYISSSGKTSGELPTSVAAPAYLRDISVDTLVRCMPEISIKAHCDEPLLGTRKKPISQQ